MSRRTDLRPEEEQQELFQAYGEYSYEYQPQQGGEMDAAGAVAQAKRRHKRQRTHGFFKFLVLLTVVTVGIIVVQELVFRLETVYVVGNESKSPQHVVMMSGLVSGSNMLSIEEADVAKAMKQDHTLIFKGMQKEYPSTIYLYVEERKTVAAMQWLGLLYTLDAEGMVMSEENSSQLPAGLPVMTGLQSASIHVGQKLSLRTPGQLEAYCTIMEELQQQLYINQVSEINLADPDNIYLVTVEGVTVRLGDAKYMRAKIGAVRTDMAYLRQLGKTGGILDVTTPENAKYMPEK